MIGFSNSEFALWRRCPRQWYITYYLGYLPANPSPVGARQFGQRWHVAQEYQYGHGVDAGFVLDVLYGQALEEYPDFEKQLRSDHELAKIMNEGYWKWVQEEGLDAGLQVVETEAEVRVDLPGFEGWVQLRAKLDQVVWDEKTGWYRFRDHKTGDMFLDHRMVENDPQMRLYALIAWLATQKTPPLAGQPVEIDPSVPLVIGGEVNTARKVKRTSRSKPPYYDRHPFRYTQERLASTLLATQQVAGEIMAARKELDETNGDPAWIDHVQKTRLRPVFIGRDCDWSCPLSAGLCMMMDEDPHGWMRALTESGAWVKGDPYERYTRGVPQLAAHQPEVG
jgi:hypothetical protein